MRRLVPLLWLLALAACDSSPTVDGGPPADARVAVDGDVPLDAAQDAGGSDAGADDAGVDGGAGEALHVLFAGNSYTGVNDLPSVVSAVLESHASSPSVETTASTPGGYRLVQHATDATTDGTTLQGAFAETWTHVVLQEQSQIPGFPDGNAEVMASRGAAVELATLAEGAGATTILYMTWGRMEGDAGNPGLFPDFSTMQDRLEVGYRAMATDARATGATVLIAPVGLGFRDVHDAEVDPLAPGTRFRSLYAGDGSHPSLAGTYLAACVIAATILSVDATSFAHVPAGLDPAEATSLREAASRVVAAEPAP